jgi:hypothetical protein
MLLDIGLIIFLAIVVVISLFGIIKVIFFSSK